MTIKETTHYTGFHEDEANQQALKTAQEQAVKLGATFGDIQPEFEAVALVETWNNAWLDWNARRGRPIDEGK